MKKYFIIPVLLICLVCFVGCNNGDKDKGSNEDQVITENEVQGPTDDEVLEAYQKALEAQSWFHICALPTDSNDMVDYNGSMYFKVERFETKDEMLKYLDSLFSKEALRDVMMYDDYIEIDGKLYTRDGARGTDITKGEEEVSIDRQDDGHIVLTVSIEILDPDNDFEPCGTEDYVINYEKTGDKWVFTNFPVMR